jgi:N-acetylneuraminic acid mutarotase
MKTAATLVAAAAMLAAAATLYIDTNHAQDGGHLPYPRSPESAPAHSEDALTVMPQAFTSFGAAAHGEHLYVIGGHTSPPHDWHNEGFSTAFYRLDLRNRTNWEVLPGGAPLQSVALVNAGDELIRIGGMTATNAPDEQPQLHSTAAVKAYNPATRHWRELPSLPEARSSHDAVVVGDRVYVLGGWRLAGRGVDPVWYEGGLVLDLSAEAPAWEPLAQSFVKRALALAEIGTHIYAVGGMTREGMTSDVAVLDIKSGEWSEAPPIPGRGFGTSAFGANGRVYATTFEGALVSHAPGEDEWRPEATLTFPRYFHRLIHTGNGEFAAVSGTSRGSHVRNIEWLKTDREPGPRITRVALPAPGSAKVRQGIFLHNNALYVFGGNNAVRDHQFAPENFLDEAFRISLNGLYAKRGQDFPVKRQSFITWVTHTGGNPRFREARGYAIGGFGHDGEAAVSKADIFAYDFATDTWRDGGVSLPVPLTQFGHTEHEGALYLFGGMDFDPARGTRGRFQMSDKVYKWSPHAEGADGFTELETRLPIRRRAFGGAQLGERYYLVGGMTANFEEVEHCDVYNFATGEWETIPAPSDVRLSPKLIPLDGKLYLVGGSSPTLDGMARNLSIEVYNPATNKWSTLIEDIGVDLGELQAFAFHHRILLYSVHNDEGTAHLIFIEP